MNYLSSDYCSLHFYKKRSCVSYHRDLTTGARDQAQCPVHLGHLISILNNTSWVSKWDTNEQFTVSLSLPHEDK